MKVCGELFAMNTSTTKLLQSFVVCRVMVRVMIKATISGPIIRGMLPPHQKYGSMVHHVLEGSLTLTNASTKVGECITVVKEAVFLLNVILAKEVCLASGILRRSFFLKVTSLLLLFLH